MWRPHLFSSGVAWTHAGRRFGLVTRTRVASAVAREQSARIFFSRSDDSAVAYLFSPLSGSGYSGGPCCQLWHAASEPCRSPHVPR